VKKQDGIADRCRRDEKKAIEVVSFAVAAMVLLQLSSLIDLGRANIAARSYRLHTQAQTKRWGC